MEAASAEGEAEPGTSWGPPLDPRVLANVVRAYEGETLQVAECDSPVYHGQGRLEFSTGYTYVGAFDRGRMHGMGRMEWQRSGVVYEGDFTHNEIAGRGTYWWPNGSSYVGEVQGGKRHGRGVFITGDRGTTSRSKADAAETESPPLLLVAPNVQEREEETAGDDENGEGDGELALLVAQSNARYDGEWALGLPQGYGELVFDAARNIRYEGQFAAGKREGRGHMHYADGSVYAGDWKDDVKCGHGVMTWMAPSPQDGDDGTSLTDDETVPTERYDGEWENDCQQGFGRHVWLMSPANAASATAATSREKNWYEGEFHDGLRHGRGVFFYANGARYEGEWKANVKDGYGLFFYEDGRVFVGLFRQDRSVEGVYATAAISSTIVSPITAVQEEPAQTAATGVAVVASPSASSLPPLASAPSSSVTGIMLYISDLLPRMEVAKREKTRKAVEYAALRINTELRALYRGCIKETRRASILSSMAPNPAEPDDSGALLEVFECRQLLSTCGFYLTGGQLESFMEDIRGAQRASALACASALNLVDRFTGNLPLENRSRNPVDPSRLEVVPSDQLLLFREFVELLVRIAHWRMTTAPEVDELEGLSPKEDAVDNTPPLADAFLELYEHMMRERKEVLRQTAPSWLSLLRAELLGKKLHFVFKKHHDELHRMFDRCVGYRLLRQQNDAREGEAEEEEGAEVETQAETQVKSNAEEKHEDAPEDAVQSEDKGEESKLEEYDDQHKAEDDGEKLQPEDEARGNDKPEDKDQEHNDSGHKEPCKPEQLEEAPASEPPPRSAKKLPQTVSIRSVLVMLRDNAPSESPMFTSVFQVRDALSALSRAFTASSPPLQGESSDKNEVDDVAEPDVFFASTELVFSEFLDVLAILLYTKQQKTLEAAARGSKKQRQQPELPLHTLVDQFLQSMKVEIRPLF